MPAAAVSQNYGRRGAFGQAEQRCQTDERDYNAEKTTHSLTFIVPKVRDTLAMINPTGSETETGSGLKPCWWLFMMPI
jgi:hypothetical protein